MLALTSALALSGCGAREGGGAGDASAGAGAGAGAGAEICELPPMREWVQDSLQDYYLFADRVSPVPLQNFASDVEVLEALRVRPEDRFSYLTDEATYDARFDQGRTFGFGWQLTRTDDELLIISRVAPESPFARAGVVRGDALIAINALPIADFLALGATEQREQLGLPDTPTSVTFTLEAITGQRRDVPVQSAEYPLVTVNDVNVIQHNGARVGYLDFTSFIETSRAELAQAFEQLNDVDELVLDLRHNGGGRVDIAVDLAAAIAGSAHADKTFIRFRHNARYAGNDQDVTLPKVDASLDLPRLFVLTSDRTCSASELVINGLEPFIDVVTIGDRTCGKPYATRPERQCGRVLNALEFSSSNALGVGDYTDGLPVDCEVADNLRTAQGRAGDPLHDAVLSFLDQGTCQLQLASSPDETTPLATRGTRAATRPYAPGATGELWFSQEAGWGEAIVATPADRAARSEHQGSDANTRFETTRP